MIEETPDPPFRPKSRPQDVMPRAPPSIATRCAQTIAPIPPPPRPCHRTPCGCSVRSVRRTPPLLRALFLDTQTRRLLLDATIETRPQQSDRQNASPAADHSRPHPALPVAGCPSPCPAFEWGRGRRHATPHRSSRTPTPTTSFPRHCPLPHSRPACGAATTRRRRHGWYASLNRMSPQMFQ